MNFGPFLGENNRLQPHALEVNVKGRRAGSYLAASNNIVIDPTGRIESRGGFTETLPATTGRSLCAKAGKMLFADGDSLKQVSFSPYAATTIDTVSSGRVCYAESNGDIYYSDGVKLSCLEAGGVVRSVGVPLPVSLAASTTTGALAPAWYQVTITYFNGVEEGGAYQSQNVELTATGGIHLVLPATPVGVTAIGAYLSGPNGEVPLLYNIYAPATATIDITAPATGRAVQLQFKDQMPAGELLAFHDARLLSAIGQVVYYSEPYNYGLTVPSTNYIQFPEEVTVMQPCVGGVYIVADKTYWLTGLGTDQMDLMPMLPYGAVKHTSEYLPTQKQVFWLSERGVVVGDEQGQVKNIQEESLLLSLAGEGAALYIEKHNRIVATNG